MVDAEPQIVRALAINLMALGYQVDTAASGEEALKGAADHKPDAMSLDLGLPGIDGVEVIQGLRGWSSAPIIVLTVREAEADKIEALDAGADAYVTKPFGIGELLARLRAALRRAAPADREQPTVVTDDFVIDLGAKTFTDREGHETRLTPTEWSVVESLVRNESKLVSQLQLLKEVWGPQLRTRDQQSASVHGADPTQTEPDPAHRRYFITEPGMGYRFIRSYSDSDTS